MRNFFIALVLANIAYAAWALLSAEPAPGAPGQPPAPGYSTQLELAGESAAPPEALPPAHAGELSAPLPTEAPVATVTVPGAPGAAEETAAVAAPEPPAVSAVDTADEVPPAVAAELDLPRCVRFGPVASAQLGEELTGRLREIGADARIEVLQVPDRTIYWVHVPPLPSPEEASEAVRKLAALGVESFVIRDEQALLNGISLGVFSKRGSALRFSESLDAIGYPVRIFESQRTRSDFFVHALLPATASGSQPEGLLSAAGGVAVADTDCPGIAPPPAAN